jgi:hypothetical protein
VLAVCPHQPTYLREGKLVGCAKFTFKAIIIKIEEWIYNLGPTRFMRHLIFMSGRLKEIEIGDKGYYR